jgi:hypothetical protein
VAAIHVFRVAVKTWVAGTSPAKTSWRRRVDLVAAWYYIDQEHNLGVGGVREDLEFQTWLLSIGVRYLTGGSDTGYVLGAGRADVKQLRALRLS